MAEESLQVSLIPASHGQAFDGLLHIGDFSTLTNRVAEQELFRSHEVAHLWWGHAVGWQGYRDQWLSEGFAEYSAMMFIEATLDQGSRYFDEMLKAITDELTGSIESAFSQFNRPGVSLLNLRAADRVGPIGHGRRCVVGEAPTAYFSQAYKKGALVLHMLRMLLRATTGSDRVFFETLRTFIDRYEGGAATTADFEAVLEDVAATDWSWFFAQWVLGAEIPTYRWSYEVDRTENGHLLRLRVTQQDVEPEFRMAIPVRVEFANGRAETVVAFSEQASADFEFTLEDEPRRVVFNPDYSVLARVKRR
jgi:aminopeptidase N